MIDKLNSLMKHWPKSQFPFPQVTRTNKGWELKVKFSNMGWTNSVESKHLLGALNTLVQEISSHNECRKAFEPLAKELTFYIREHGETIENLELLPVSFYAVHTEKDSYVFNDPYSIVDSLTIRELRTMESQQTVDGKVQRIPHNYRRLIGKALRQSLKK
jgi:hypothetical protein